MENQTLTVNDTEYDIADLTDKAKYLVTEVQEIDFLRKQAEQGIEAKQREIRRLDVVRAIAFDELVSELETVPVSVTPEDAE